MVGKKVLRVMDFVDTREVLLKETQLQELLGCDMSDPEYNDRFMQAAGNQKLIGCKYLE